MVSSAVSRLTLVGTNAFAAPRRLPGKTTLGPIPQGGQDGDRLFIAKRAFIWDGQRLAAEAGLNVQGQPIWRQQVAPGQRGLDDAPLVRVETDLQGAPSTKTYALIRDEMGSVLAVAEERAGQSPNLLARYLYAPYGQRHTELGPELVRIEFDAGVVKVGDKTQTTTANETVAGALEIVTTSPLSAATLIAGLTIEHYDPASSSWTTATRTDFAIGTADGDATDLRVMRIQGWVKATNYRITLLPGLTDTFGRIVILPSGETQGVAVELDVPSDGVMAPDYARSFALACDNAASDTLGGAFPGGQTSGFQGAWSDPTMGLGYHRARWMDWRNATWLSADPEGAVDSHDLYSALRQTPWMGTDPLGLFDVPIHQAITTQAAQESGVFLGEDATFSPTLKAINHGHFLADNPLGPYASIDAQHFDNSQFEAGIALRLQLLEEFQTSSDPVAAAEAFGRYLHATHDFYAHSSYVEILVVGSYSSVAPPDLPLWDFRWPASGEFAGMISGEYRFWSGQGCRLLSVGCNRPGQDPGHYGSPGIGMNKDSNSTPEGSTKARCGWTYFEIARALAERQTAVEVRANAIRLREINGLIKNDIAARARHAQERLDAIRAKGWMRP